MSLVSITQIARVFGITPARVGQLVTREGMPKRARGQYDLGEAMQWYIKYLQAALKARAGEGPDGSLANLTSARTRREGVQIERMELENAERRGELIHWTEVKALSDAHAALQVESFSSLPQRCTTDPELQKRIESELNAVRRHWADYWHARASEIQQQSMERAKRRK